MDTITDILRCIGRAADQHGLRAYAVGGYVRDRLMERTTKDIDVLVPEEGGGIRLAEILHKES